MGCNPVGSVVEEMMKKVEAELGVVVGFRVSHMAFQKWMQGGGMMILCAGVCVL